MSYTSTFGVVLRPSWVSGLRVSVDYYKIKIPGAITDILDSRRIQGCLLYGIQEYCQGLSFSSTNPQQVTQIRNQSINAALIETWGEDYEISYRIPAKIFGGHVTTSVMATHVSHYATHGCFRHDPHHQSALERHAVGELCDWTVLHHV